MVEKEWDFGVEILRLLLMIFVVAHHVIVHGFGFSSLKDGTWDGDSTYIFALMNSFLVVAVNIFFLISGYFGVKRNMKKVGTLHIQAMLYAFISALIVFAISGGCFYNHFGSSRV